MKVFTLKIRSEKIPNPIRVIEPKRAMISTLNFIRLFLIYIQRATYQVGKQETYASILADVLFALYDVWKWRRTFKYDKRWGCELFKTNETTTICVAAHEFVEEHFVFVVAPIRPVQLTIGPINLSHAMLQLLDDGSVYLTLTPASNVMTKRRRTSCTICSLQNKKKMSYMQ